MTIEEKNKILKKLIPPFIKHPNTSAIFSDIDGTISMIEKTHQKAYVPEDIKILLDKIRSKYGCLAFVSGRLVEQAKYMVGIDDVTYIGNHGLEIIEDKTKKIEYTQKDISTNKEIIEELKKIDIFNIGGIDIEDKRASVAIHFRKALEQANIQVDNLYEAISAIAAKYNRSLLKGRRVVEIRPSLNITKGTAVRKMLRTHPEIKRALYIGDDITDIDVFRELKSWQKTNQTVAVNIGMLSDEADDLIQEKSIDLFFKNITEVKELFKLLADNKD